MNLFFRLFYLLIASWFKPPLPIEKPGNTLSVRVFPNDLDLNMHMNNGRYLTICDLSRVDMFLRTGLAKTMYIEGWIPVIAEHTMRYKRPLKLFQRYDITLDTERWDEKYFYMKHQFWVDGRVIAEGTSKGCVLSKNGTIAPEQVMDVVAARLDAKNR